MGQPGLPDGEFFDKLDSFADGEMSPVGLGLEPVEDEQVDAADERLGLVAEDFGSGM